MSTLQILCPNGRRQNVKTTPNTKLLQVLEEVCQKQKFLPAEDYKLVHGVGRISLDLTLSVRFANLPNNAKLELVKLDKARAESEVLIALQLESGERLQHGFAPSTTLWEVLQHWENQPDSLHKGRLTNVDSSQSPPLHPVVVYMREEVTGEMALKEKLLRNLGLTGGKAALRLFHRPVDDETLAKVAESIEKERQRKAKLEKLSSKSEPLAGSNLPPSSSAGTSVKDIPTTSAQTQNLPAVGGSDNEGSGRPAKVGKMEVTQDTSESEPMEVEASGSTTVAMDTDDAKDSKPAVLGAQGYSQPQREAAQSLRDLNVPGLQIFTPDDFNQLTPQEQQIASRLAASIMPRISQQVAGATSQGSANASAPVSQPNFSNFKFPEETKGQNLQQHDNSQVRREDFQPCERETIVYSLEEPVEQDGGGAQSSEIPDDFFEVTERDLQVLISAQRKKMQELDNQPLMTSAMRKSRLEEEYGQYDRVVIRFQFPDKFVLQGLFRPRETVHSLKKFVKNYLEDKSLPFYLYTTPPKCVLKDDSDTLIESRLVPATVVYFGCEQHKEHYLSQAVMSEVRPRLQAEEIVSQCLSSYSSSPTEGSSDGPSTSSGRGKQPAARRVPSKSSTSLPSSSSSHDQPSDTGSKPVPKWFKIGKK